QSTKSKQILAESKKAPESYDLMKTFLGTAGHSFDQLFITGFDHQLHQFIKLQEKPLLERAKLLGDKAGAFEALFESSFQIAKAAPDKTKIEPAIIKFLENAVTKFTVRGILPELRAEIEAILKLATPSQENYATM